MASDLNSLLLERLGGSGEGLPSVQDLLTEMAAADPRMALLAKYMAMRRAAPETNPAPEEDDEDQPVSAEIYEKVKAIRRELDELRLRNDDLAAALGACYLCWGTRRNCPHCHGQGRPGAFAVDRALFDEFVRPTLPREPGIQMRDVSANGGEPNSHGSQGGTA